MENVGGAGTFSQTTTEILISPPLSWELRVFLFCLDSSRFRKSYNLLFFLAKRRGPVCFCLLSSFFLFYLVRGEQRYT